MHPNLLHSNQNSSTPSSKPPTSWWRALLGRISNVSAGSWTLFITCCVLGLALVRVLFFGKKAVDPSPVEKRLLDIVRERQNKAKAAAAAPLPVVTKPAVDAVRNQVDEAAADDGVIEP